MWVQLRVGTFLSTCFAAGHPGRQGEEPHAPTWSEAPSPAQSLTSAQPHGQQHLASPDTAGLLLFANLLHDGGDSLGEVEEGLFDKSKMACLCVNLVPHI